MLKYPSRVDLWVENDEFLEVASIASCRTRRDQSQVGISSSQLSTGFES